MTLDDDHAVRLPCSEQGLMQRIYSLEQQISVVNAQLQLVNAQLAQVMADKQQTDKLLRKSEAPFRMMAENAVDVIWRLDAEYYITYLSPSDEKSRGYSADEMIGKHIFEMFDDEGIATIKKQRNSGKKRSNEACR